MTTASADLKTDLTSDRAVDLFLIWMEIMKRLIFLPCAFTLSVDVAFSLLSLPIASSLQQAIGQNVIYTALQSYTNSLLQVVTSGHLTHPSLSHSPRRLATRYTVYHLTHPSLEALSFSPASPSALYTPVTFSLPVTSSPLQPNITRYGIWSTLP